jgi:mRNA interferase MazF
LLPDGLVFDGVILTDQIKNLNWRAQIMEVVGKAPDEVVNECLDKIRTFL